MNKEGKIDRREMIYQGIQKTKTQLKGLIVFNLKGKNGNAKAAKSKQTYKTNLA